MASHSVAGIVTVSGSMLLEVSSEFFESDETCLVIKRARLSN